MGLPEWHGSLQSFLDKWLPLCSKILGVRSGLTHFEKFFFGGMINALSHAVQYAREFLKCRQGPQSSTSSGKPLSFD